MQHTRRMNHHLLPRRHGLITPLPLSRSGRRLSLCNVQEEARGEAAEEELLFIAAGLGGIEPETGDEDDELLADFLRFFEGTGINEVVPAPFFSFVFPGFEPLFIDID